MKNLISIIVILSVFFLFSCESKNHVTNPSESSEYVLRKPPPVKGKPTSNTIISLKINDESIIINNNESYPEGLVTLYKNEPNIVSLSVTSDENDPIIRVSVEMRYDADVSHSIRSNAEFGGFIYKKYFDETESKTSLDVTITDWDLTLSPIASEDPTYTGNFRVTDQLSTRADLVPDHVPAKADHFYFRMTVSTVNGGVGFRNWKWVENELDPLGTFHIADVEHIETIANKRDYDIYWKVLLHDESCNPLQHAEAYYFSDDFPEGSGVGRFGVESSGVDGWQYFTSTLTKRDFPFNRYFTGVQWYGGLDDEGNAKAMSVYDPSQNRAELGLRPSITVQTPND